MTPIFFLSLLAADEPHPAANPESPLRDGLKPYLFSFPFSDHDADTRALMKEWGVRVVPLFMLFRNGEKVTEWSGAKPEVLRENVIEACNDKEKATMVTA